MKPETKALAVLTCTGLLAGGCTTLPDRIDALEDARATVEEVSAAPGVEQVAQNDLERARSALQQAEAAYEDGESIELIRHYAYLAERRAEIVRQRLQEQEARQTLAQLENDRQRLVLQAREREVERSRAQAEEYARESQVYRQQAAAAQAEAAELRSELQAMEAEQTERGWLLTLEDVLFATGEADLQPGTRQTLQRLAQFLREHPERRLLIEGHTDSTGPEDLNETLSRQRAEAVREALVTMGVDSSRLRAVGMGEDFPVASNQTSAGRQQNRRVEIVFSGTDGEFPEDRRQATAAVR